MHHNISKQFREENAGTCFGLSLQWDEKISRSELTEKLNLQLMEVDDQLPLKGSVCI